MDWKHTFLFLVVAIPSVAILTRVIAWICRKKKPQMGTALPEAREGREGSEPRVGKPYATHEEYMNDLRGTVDLEEVLARCRAGVPKDWEKVRKDAVETARRDRKVSHDKVWDEGASHLQRLMSEEARKAADRVQQSLLNAVVPVSSGGVGGDGSDGGLVTGLGSPPPAQDQPKLQIHRENSCPACRGDEKTSGHTYSCYMCNRVVVPNTPR